jgi:hypothetical protein
MKGLTGWLIFGVAAIVVMYIVFHVDAIKGFVTGVPTVTSK